MEFRILGPLQVSAGDRCLPLTAPRQRALLVTLLLRANQVVWIERLIEELWPETPPGKAEVALRMVVSRLRRLLAAAAAEGDPASPLLTRPGGYLLEIDPERLDARRFERLAGEGHQALAAGSAREAAERLRAALALWTGPALADVPATPIVTAEAERLEVARLAALRARIDADLACGRDAEVLADLQALAASQPLDEGVCARLMRVLCRAGRQAEALAAYQALRRRLVEELGVDPGAELRRLQHAVLTADPALTAPAAPPERRQERPRPAQLPPDIGDFTGRADHVAALCGLLRRARDARREPAVPVHGIVGSAGVGKTTLAVHVAQRVRHRYRDGQLWADLRGASQSPTAPGDVLAAFLSALGVDGGDLPYGEAERAALYRSLLAERSVLVVLDDARDAAHVKPLLPGSPTCAVVVTSRDSLATLPGVQRVRLDVLDEAEALDLIAHIAGAEAVDAEPGAARRVARLCGHLPLALRVAASRAAEQPSHALTWLADRLADQRRRLHELELQDLSVRSGFALSYQLLRQAPAGDLAAPALRLLGLLETPDVTLAAAARLLDVPAPAALAALERLTAVHFLEQHQPARYRMHELVRLYARERAATEDPEERRAEAVARVLRWYLATVRRAALLVRPVGLDPLTADEAALAQPLDGRDEALRWFEAERSNLLAAVGQAAAAPAWAPLCLALVCALPPLSRLSGLGEEWERANLAALRVARDLGDRRAAARIHVELALVRSRAGDETGSTRQLEQALDAYRAVGDRDGEARSLINLGVACHRLRRLPEAARYYEQTLELAREIGQRRYEAYALANLAAMRRDLGQPDQAMRLDRDAIAIFREIGDRPGEADATDDLAGALRAAGRFPEAMSAHHEALETVRVLADRPREGAMLRELAATLLGAADPRGAVNVLGQALGVLTEVGDRYGEACARRQLGAAFRALGDRDRARQSWREALSLFSELDSPEADDLRAELSALR